MTQLLADTSAWHRSRHAAVAERWADHLVTDEIATCHQVRLEVLYSARSARDYDRLAEELTALHQIPCDVAAFERALEVQSRLARRALHHRSVKIADLVIAASAELAGVTVWHYDEDFDRIARITGQPVEWIAPRGTL
ncbi:MAG: PIN domain nuclease [Acidimicrobiales bacterium]